MIEEDKIDELLGASKDTEPLMFEVKESTEEQKDSKEPAQSISSSV